MATSFVDKATIKVIAGKGGNGIRNAFLGLACGNRKHALLYKGGGGANEEDIGFGILNLGELDHVGIQLFQLSCNLQLFLKAKGLSFSAKCGVCNLNVFHGSFFPFCLRGVQSDFGGDEQKSPETG